MPRAEQLLPSLAGNGREYPLFLLSAMQLKHCTTCQYAFPYRNKGFMNAFIICLSFIIQTFVLLNFFVSTSDGHQFWLPNEPYWYWNWCTEIHLEILIILHSILLSLNHTLWSAPPLDAHFICCIGFLVKPALIPGEHRSNSLRTCF